MREGIGSTFIFTLVITFTLIFAGFLVLAINYNRAYRLKNEVTSMIERYEGITYNLNDDVNAGGSIEVINKYLINNNYTATGSCPSNAYGIIASTDQIKQNIEYPASNDKKYNYCLEYTQNNHNCTGIFRITLFFDFNLPVLGDLGQYKVSGQTNEMSPVYIGADASGQPLKVTNRSACK